MNTTDYGIHSNGSYMVPTALFALSTNEDGRKEFNVFYNLDKFSR
jgi:hypothetical protein